MANGYIDLDGTGSRSPLGAEIVAVENALLDIPVAGITFNSDGAVSGYTQTLPSGLVFTFTLTYLDGALISASRTDGTSTWVKTFNYTGQNISSETKWVLQ